MTDAREVLMLRKLLDFAGKAVLLNLEELEAAIAEAERNLSSLEGLDQAMKRSDIEMAKRVLVFTREYRELVIDIARDYRRSMMPETLH